jgi:hypothetical protein
VHPGRFGRATLTRIESAIAPTTIASETPVGTCQPKSGTSIFTPMKVSTNARP